MAELEYGQNLVASVKADELLNELFDTSKLTLYNSVTREDFPFQGRITDLIESGKLYDDLGVAPLDPATDRAMICGSAAMLKDTKALLEQAGLTEGANNRPAEFVIERAFAG